MPDKPDYRYKYFRDTVNTTLTITGGGIIAIVTFASGLDHIISKALLQIGLGILLISVALILVQQLIMALSAGFWWDWKNSNFEDPETGKLTHSFGVAAGLSIMLSIMLSIVGFAILSVFLSRNIQ